MCLKRRGGNFEEDWTLHNEIIEYATRQLQEGKTQKETRALVLRSQLYKKWRSKWRTFGAGYRSKQLYKDLSDKVCCEISFKQLDDLITSYFSNIKRSNNFGVNDLPTCALSHYDLFKNLLNKLGYSLTENEMAYEIASLSCLIGLNYGILGLSFLCLINGNSILTDKDDLIDKLAENKDLVCSFMQEFELKYKIKH